MIPVTKPFLPPKEDYDRYLQGIWQSTWITSHDPLANDLVKMKAAITAQTLAILVTDVLGYPYDRDALDAGMIQQVNLVHTTKDCQN